MGFSFVARGWKCHKHIAIIENPGGESKCGESKKYKPECTCKKPLDEL